MATEGTLWFCNLLIPDTTLILPLSLSLMNLILIEVSFCVLYKLLLFADFIVYISLLHFFRHLPQKCRVW